MSKKCTRLWREAHSEVKMSKSRQCRSTFGSWVVQKMHAAVAQSIFWSQNGKSTTCSDHFWTFNRHCVTGDSAPCQKWAKREVFCCSVKYYVRRETLEEGLLRCISHGRCRTRDVPIRHVKKSGRWFPEKGSILEHQIFRFTFAKMMMRDRCNTSYDLASFFCGRRNTSQYFLRECSRHLQIEL